MPTWAAPTHGKHIEDVAALTQLFVLQNIYQLWPWVQIELITLNLDLYQIARQFENQQKQEWDLKSWTFRCHICYPPCTQYNVRGM